MNHPAMLTPEEICTIRSECPAIAGREEALCDAQVKKVVKWLEEHNQYVYIRQRAAITDKENGLHILPEDWQSLREVAGTGGQG